MNKRTFGVIGQSRTKKVSCKFCHSVHHYFAGDTVKNTKTGEIGGAFSKKEKKNQKSNTGSYIHCVQLKIKTVTLFYDSTVKCFIFNMFIL